VLLQIDTLQCLLHCQQKELEHRRAKHDACYVVPVVDEKQDEATSSSEEIKPVAQPFHC